jgi:hypothetical protein
MGEGVFDEPEVADCGSRVETKMGDWNEVSDVEKRSRGVRVYVSVICVMREGIAV